MDIPGVDFGSRDARKIRNDACFWLSQVGQSTKLSRERAQQGVVLLALLQGLLERPRFGAPFLVGSPNVRPSDRSKRCLRKADQAGL